LTEYIRQLNHYGSTRTPFLFIIDFEMKKPVLYPLEDLPDGIEFSLQSSGIKPMHELPEKLLIFDKYPISLAAYSKGFNHVKAGLNRGDSFLLNLTYPSKVVSNYSLEEIYAAVEAPYKLKYYNDWVVFSPETFIKISGNTIKTFPMKGTIDAGIPGAADIILKNPKEKAEHNTIVDLMRNDISKVAKQVEVTRYRYLDYIHTSDKDILQVSSEISGQLPVNFHHHLGDILLSLLPAGSISGAPKAKTIDIIREAEGQDRGYYTGIAFWYDGYQLDSCVLIRYLEQVGEEMYARSGGGITHMSNLDDEYQEMIDKVYVPIAGNHKNSPWKGDEHTLPQPAL
jgi:para-aminobenzoate synthetase component 1